MCTMATKSEPLSPSCQTGSFASRMDQAMNDASLMLMLSLGHRTGLLDTMAAMESATSGEIARRAKLNERYVREWLGAMFTGGIIELDAEAKTYRLPPRHAHWLTRGGLGDNYASLAQWIGLLGSAEDLVADAFEHGQGVPYSAYRRFHEVMAEESQQTTVNALEQHILPLVPGLTQRLDEGIEVADVGCGRGEAALKLATLFPNSRFTGLDFSQEAIAAAMTQASECGLSNVRFILQDAGTWNARDEFDLILAFDAIHDQANPGKVLENIFQAMREDGVFLMQDIGASSHTHQNEDHPMGTLLYTISCMHCMSVSLAAGGAGLGAVWGKELALDMLCHAGFGNVSVEELPHDEMNYYYVCEKQ